MLVFRLSARLLQAYAGVRLQHPEPWCCGNLRIEPTLEEGNIMRTALNAVVTGLVLAGATSVCLAQDEKAPPRMTVTGGQGGYIVLPDTRPAPPRYALTGESRPGSRAWQSAAGPSLRVGQSEIILPAAR
jgi:hypothetical protein